MTDEEAEREAYELRCEQRRCEERRREEEENERVQVEALTPPVDPLACATGPQDDDCPLGPNGRHAFTLWEGRQCEHCMQTQEEIARAKTYVALSPQEADALRAAHQGSGPRSPRSMGERSHADRSTVGAGEAPPVPEEQQRRESRSLKGDRPDGAGALDRGSDPTETPITETEEHGLRESAVGRLYARGGSNPPDSLPKTPERWALACKTTVELLGRVTRGADLTIEIAEALMNFPQPEARGEAPPVPEERTRALIDKWRAAARRMDDGTGVTACAIAAAGNRAHADELEAILTARGEAPRPRTATDDFPEPFRDVLRQFDEVEAKLTAEIGEAPRPDLRTWQPIDTLALDVDFVIAAWPCSGAESGYDVGEVERMDGGGWHNLYGRCVPTHWMPLPDPPVVPSTPQQTGSEPT